MMASPSRISVRCRCWLCTFIKPFLNLRAVLEPYGREEVKVALFRCFQIKPLGVTTTRLTFYDGIGDLWCGGCSESSFYPTWRIKCFLGVTLCSLQKASIAHTHNIYPKDLEIHDSRTVAQRTSKEIKFKLSPMRPLYTSSSTLIADHGCR